MVQNAAFQFVIMIGIVNLFGDITYEGGAVINGQFLGMLGASGALISIIAGVGEFFGYSFRSVAGLVSDKTGKFWLVTIIGYVINLLAVPAMALATSWQVAALLIIAERIGRAIRKPAVESMLSYATGKLGKGWVFGLNTALDETGATIGPLLIALIIYLKADYKIAYASLLVPALLAIVALTFARVAFPLPSRLEKKGTKREKKFSLAYWLYMTAGALFACGLMSYELVAFHFVKIHLISIALIPILLAYATLSGIIANLILGRSFDKFGLPVIIIAVILSAAFVPCAFLGNFSLVLVAMPLLGIGYAVQDTLLKAVVADLLPEGKRSLAFGLFYTGYGCGWLIGSIVAGLLYNYSLLGLAIYACIIQLCSIPVFFIAARCQSSRDRHRS